MNYNFSQDQSLLQNYGTGYNGLNQIPQNDGTCEEDKDGPGVFYMTEPELTQEVLIR
jgi:hypothetical protein